ncbi:hypothetical protein ASF52_11030 [Methylobacterium sp. Leaf112]|nr:hypothetical protein ASF52_11030 [Methylobacterium sp. Leaf112]
MQASETGAMGPDGSARVSCPERGLPGRGLTQVALFSGTLLLAAFLLFSLQPIFTKRILPVLGGTPGVWSVAMVFFQALLLAGYAYAHALTRWLPFRIAATVHGAVLLGGAAFLPIGIAARYGSVGTGDEALWLVGLFLASVGAPFFALSASAPLLQAWFARSDDPAAADPYFLYRASNLGSFAALLAYPLAIEPMLGLAEQTRLWSVGYGLGACALAACALSVMRAARGPVRAAEAEAEPIGPSRRLAWIGLSAVPSGLLVAVTAHITTDVAAIPLMWVIPLALYLLTFVITFRPLATWPERPLAVLLTAGTAVVLGVAVIGRLPFLIDLPLSLGLGFVASLVAHRAVYGLRPSARRLTEFYLFTSLGGMLGGLFAALIAPRLFPTVAEYPLLLVAALACRPGTFAGLRRVRPDLRHRLRPALLAGAFVGIVGVLGWCVPGLTPHLAMIVLMAGLLVSWRAPRRVVGFAALLCALGLAMPHLVARDYESRRSFFGVHRIETDASGRFRLLTHGTTLHGAIRIRADDGGPALGRPESTTYYAPGNAIADVLAVGRAAHGPLPAVAVVGLGAGSLACQSEPGEAWTFYEIDPVVIRLATDPARFRFLQECTPSARIVQGDARLTLAAETGSVRVLIVDAFSSDAIPMHLLTGEALALYRSRLDAQGVLALHISNRHFDLRPALARAAAEQGLTLLQRLDRLDEPFEAHYRAPALVVIATRDPVVEREAVRLGWTPVAPDMTRRPWTDDYANVLEAFFDKLGHTKAAPLRD